MIRIIYLGILLKILSYIKCDFMGFYFKFLLLDFLVLDAYNATILVLYDDIEILGL